ncbi:hypothetical protein GRF59_14345 [Paenibacillus sp. HJL G12]|uniref:peptidyl-tRNA hydrolase n=1 Tax=Paenibacillus dendrobii TaxID=2691084 RepID=A0A7X3LH62_9BACL|nr:aminoacyl-tRNA hydrolase [Paenibacillus dendrobii]MWV44797.1 hypothetical protein [Paenibacillus dendrobii]
MKNEIVQYFVVNKELNMSPGKIAAQVAHVATNITHNENEAGLWSEWHENELPKIILRGREKDLIKSSSSRDGTTYEITEGQRFQRIR